MAIALLVNTDTTTLGSWLGVYGNDGWNIPSDTSSIPSYATISNDTTTPVSLEDPADGGDSDYLDLLTKASSHTDRIRSQFTDTAASFGFDINFNDGKIHQISFYFYDSTIFTSYTNLKITDLDTSIVIYNNPVQSYGTDKVYYSFMVQGNLRFAFENPYSIYGYSSILTGVFFDQTSSASIPLYLFGYGIIEEGLNLFLNAVPTDINNHIPLYLHGNTSGTTYITGGIPLFLSGAAFSGSLNLFLQGISQPGSIEEDLNLFLQATYNDISASIPLSLLCSNTGDLSLYYLTLDQLFYMSLDELYNLSLNPGTFNGWPIYNTLSLYIKGDGILDGSIPSSGSMNLFLQGQRIAQGSIPLFLQNRDPVSGELPLYLHGVLGIPSGSIPLYAKGTNAFSGYLPLFIRGNSPQEEL